MNGPDDFCFVVDRAFGPGRGRKARFAREWITYVDDLTVRTGRVIDGQFLTDAERDNEIKKATKTGPALAPQPASDALEALGVQPLKGLGSSAEKKEKHDERVSDHNRPTRCLALVHSGARPVRFPRLIRIWGCRLGFVVLGSCFPHFATQPFRSDRGLGRAEGRTGGAGSREESESTRRVARSSLAELWEKEPRTASQRMAETALSAFASGEHRHQAGPSQPEPAEAAVRSSERKRGGLKHKKSHKKLRRAKKKTPSAAEVRRFRAVCRKRSRKKTRRAWALSHKARNRRLRALHGNGVLQLNHLVVQRFASLRCLCFERPMRSWMWPLRRFRM